MLYSISTTAIGVITCPQPTSMRGGYTPRCYFNGIDY